MDQGERILQRVFSQRGFTLIELLVSVLVFMIVMIAVYFLFDQGQWVYLHSSRRASIQQIARSALEQMEREVRMAGFGVPTGSNFGGTTRWTPTNVFVLSPGKVYFRADIDNRHTWVTQNIAAADTTWNVEDPALVCPSPTNTRIVLAQQSRRWQSAICTAADAAAGTITVDTAAVSACPSEECDIFTPEHVFYRLTGDADNDGVCDNTGPFDEPYCSIERAVTYGNDPIADAAVPADTAFDTIATNIISFLPENSGLIRITLTVRDRAMQRPQEFQDVILTSEILVRDIAY